MPPKKKTGSAAGGDAASSEGAWKWTPENERTLLLLILGRGTLGKDDYEKMASGLSSKTNWNAVRQRVNKLRLEQKKMYEGLGWDVPGGGGGGGGGGGSAAPAAQKKRKGGEEGGEETQAGAKKKRVRKGTKSELKVWGGDEKEDGKEEEEDGKKEETDNDEDNHDRWNTGGRVF